MARPQFITFTGADDRTDPIELGRLAADYPVEFGILISESRKGTPRYPTGMSTTRLVRNNPNLRFSFHLCGETARGVASGLAPFYGLVGDNVRRVQVNLAQASYPDVTRIRRYGLSHHVETIVQSRDPFEFPCDINVSWLYDPSGGRGESPANWPRPAPGLTMVGYAGGLGPDTREAFNAIAEVAGQTAYWIDMESKVRNQHDEFDLGLCRKVCEAVYG